MRKVDLTINVPDVDIVVVKVVAGDTVGTLHLQKEGLAFSPPNTKKASRSIIGWDKLPQVIALANGFAKVQA